MGSLKRIHTIEGFASSPEGFLVGGVTGEERVDSSQKVLVEQKQ